MVWLWILTGFHREFIVHESANEGGSHVNRNANERRQEVGGGPSGVNCANKELNQYDKDANVANENSSCQDGNKDGNRDVDGNHGNDDGNHGTDDGNHGNGGIDHGTGKCKFDNDDGNSGGNQSSGDGNYQKNNHDHDGNYDKNNGGHGNAASVVMAGWIYQGFSDYVCSGFLNERCVLDC